MAWPPLHGSPGGGHPGREPTADVTAGVPEGLNRVMSPKPGAIHLMRSFIRSSLIAVAAAAGAIAFAGTAGAASPHFGWEAAATTGASVPAAAVVPSSSRPTIRPATRWSPTTGRQPVP